MNKTFRAFALALSLIVLCGVTAHAQTALIATTLSAAIDSKTRTIPVASTTSILAGYNAIVHSEVMVIVSVGTGVVTVAPRGSAGQGATAHITGAMFLAGPAAAFVAYAPSGSCTAGTGLFANSPVINVRTGDQFLCSINGLVAPGFGNITDLPNSTTAVASAAGKITPSGPMFHVTGTAAVTGFNIPVGFDPTSGGQICMIPDGLYTTTNANNFAIASTAVVSKILCMTYDPNVSKFFPSY